MFFAKYKDADGNEKNKLYFSWDEYHADTFCPDCEEIAIIEFKIPGYSYQKKKAAAHEIAVEWSALGDTAGLSWYDLNHISEWFYTVGSRFGLLREFRANGIC